VSLTSISIICDCPRPHLNSHTPKHTAFSFAGYFRSQSLKLFNQTPSTKLVFVSTPLESVPDLYFNHLWPSPAPSEPPNYHTNLQIKAFSLARYFSSQYLKLLNLNPSTKLVLSQLTLRVSPTSISIICDHPTPHLNPQTTIHIPQITGASFTRSIFKGCRRTNCCAPKQAYPRGFDPKKIFKNGKK